MASTSASALLRRMLQMGATIYDLEEAELCYAPAFGSAKDPVNFAGMVAADVLKGDMPLSHWAEAKEQFLLDVREPVELAVESVPEALNIPLGQLASTPRQNCPATARFMSFAVPVSVPTMRRASCCSMVSKPKTSPAGCCRWRTTIC